MPSTTDSHLIERVRRALVQADPSLGNFAPILVEAAVEQLQETSDLTAVVVRGGAAERIIKFKPVAAISAVAGISVGIATASTPWLAGAAILSTLESLRGIVAKQGGAAAAVLWSVYCSEGHRLLRTAARAEFAKLCGETTLELDQFSTAVSDLVELGCLAEQEAMLEICDQVIIFWR